MVDTVNHAENGWLVLTVLKIRTRTRHARCILPKLRCAANDVGPHGLFWAIYSL